jgi:hypothetical protein
MIDGNHDFFSPASIDCRVKGFHEKARPSGVARGRLCGGGCDPTMDNQCDSTTAVYCNPVTSLCVQAQFSQAGGPCGNAADGTLTLCAGSGLCQSADGATMGTCQAVATDGAACDPLNGPSCLPPAACLGTACALLDPTTCH